MRFDTKDRRRVLAAIGALTGLLCLAPCARAEEPLRWKFKVGDKLAYNMTQDMNMVMNMGPSSQMTTNVHQVMDMSWDVQGVNDQGEAVILQKFDRVQMKMTGPMAVDYDTSKDEPVTGMAAAFAPLYKAMTKGDFEVTMTARGEIKDVKVPPEVLDALKSSPGAAQMGDLAKPEGFQKMIMQNAFVLPENAPKKGDHWSTTATVNNPVAGRQTVETSYTFVEMKEINGEQFAVFQPNIKMSFGPVAEPAKTTDAKDAKADDAKTDGDPKGDAKSDAKSDAKPAASPNPGMQMKVKDQKSDGEVLFNATAGRLSSMSVKQDLSMEISVAAQTLQQQIHQDIEVKVTPKSAAGASE
jgi:hypothetical protein